MNDVLKSHPQHKIYLMWTIIIWLVWTILLYQALTDRLSHFSELINFDIVVYVYVMAAPYLYHGSWGWLLRKPPIFREYR